MKKGDQTTLILVVVLLVLLYMRSKASANTRARPGGNAPEGQGPPPAPQLTPAQVKQRVRAPIQVLTVDDPFGRFNF